MKNISKGFKSRFMLARESVGLRKEIGKGNAIDFSSCALCGI